MTYKTELHLHSAEVSACATSSAKEIVEAYLEAGYTTLVLTNHFSPFSYKCSRYDLTYMTPEEKCEYYIRGYHALREAAEGKLHVLFGMELYPLQRDCDYLIYGMTEEFLRAHTDLMELGLEQTVALTREAGMIFCQAHPFRNNMKVTNPELLDAIETHNAHTGDFRNEIAELWANKFSLIKLSGSDYHGSHHKAESGIATDFPITTNEELLAVLRSGNYKQIHRGIITE